MRGVVRFWKRWRRTVRYLSRCQGHYVVRATDWLVRFATVPCGKREESVSPSLSLWQPAVHFTLPCGSERLRCVGRGNRF